MLEEEVVVLDVLVLKVKVVVVLDVRELDEVVLEVDELVVEQLT